MTDAPGLLKAWRLGTQISKREAKRRLAAGPTLELSQEVAATRVGVSQHAWCRWEGGLKEPRIENAIRIEAETDGVCPVHAWGQTARRAS